MNSELGTVQDGGYHVYHMHVHHLGSQEQGQQGGREGGDCILL